MLKRRLLGRRRRSRRPRLERNVAVEFEEEDKLDEPKEEASEHPGSAEAQAEPPEEPVEMASGRQVLSLPMEVPNDESRDNSGAKIQTSRDGDAEVIKKMIRVINEKERFSGYYYPQRVPLSYLSQNSQVAPRSNDNTIWDQRPSSSQGFYNYGQLPGPEYGHHPPYEANHAPPPQHYGPQPTPYAQGGPTTHLGYGPPPPPMYTMEQPPPHGQQPVEAPYQVPAQTYGPPPQQQYPFAQQQTYPNPPYGPAPAPAPASDVYGQTYPFYPPSSGYGQPVAGHAQQAYPQAGGGYGLYPQPAACAHQQQQPAPNNAAAYVHPASYGATPQPGWYDQSGGGYYGNVAAAAPVVGYDQSGGFGAQQQQQR